jgi:hypothetical protein
MKLVCLSMIQKQDSKISSGKIQSLQEWEKYNINNINLPYLY